MEEIRDFDPEFYQSWYPDLKGFTREQLIKHWKEYGHSEGRAANERQLLEQCGVSEEIESAEDLDIDFYLSYYDDLRKSGIESKLQAMIHWLKHGRHENRFKNFEQWLSENGGFSAVNIRDVDISTVISINKSYGINVSLKDILECIVGNINYPIRFFEENSRNSQFYLDMGTSFYIQYKSGSAENLLRSARTSFNTSITYEPNARALELLGNTYFDVGDFNTAIYIYRTIINNFKVPGKHVHFLLAQALKEAGDFESALHEFKSGILKNQELTSRYSELDDLVEGYFDSKSGLIHALAVQDARGDLAENYYTVAKNIYDSYVCLFGGKVPNNLSSINANKILIIGDYHVPQCVRYRIDQKVEQLEHWGKEVTCIDWTKLKDSWNDLVLHDLVIFYRVPAVPIVIKAIAQVNATGKLSIFEIDDLLFEETYPPAIDTFGGYVDIETHIGLRKGMAQFRAAARLCRYGMASTLPLCHKLKSLVFGGECILHRNGLDKHNIIKTLDRSGKKTVDIFYGSGTQAHNSDFLNQALPAIEKILRKHSKVRLIIAGYLSLPEEFMNNYSDQVRQLPLIKNINAYWSILQHADINLAVLLDDEINGCKSELKWFEAACFGIPSVVSTTQNYRDVLINGEDAYLVSDEESWFSALEKLVSSADLRKKIASKALEKVKSQYTVSALGERLVSQLEKVSNKKNEKNKAKKKVALVNVFFPPQAIGGATRVVADNFSILQKQYGDDFELVVFTSDVHCTTPYQLTTYDYNGVRVYRSTILYRENMDWHPKDPVMYDLFTKFLQLEKPDLVHFHCVQRLTASIVEATRSANIPYIVTVHDAWWISDHQFLVDDNGTVYPEGHPDMYAPRCLPNNVSLSESIERTSYLKQLLHDARTVLTVSDSFAEIYKKNGIHEIQVNKNGISTTINWDRKDTSYTDKVVCAHIGGMAEHKGYFLLKKAIEQIQPDNIEMLIVDHAKEDGYIENTYWGRVPVTFIGRVNQENIVDLYRKIDVLFAPSTWPESYGLVTREAAACGCWVVASNLGGIGEDVLDGINGYRIDPEFITIENIVKSIDFEFEHFKLMAPSSDIRTANEQVVELVGFYNE
ncbi:glycosyltransferase [Microbulbifer thermotolerans]|uniref:glycosyltransferase n=1 Tax=Microbulbifer thermotolerans TaxID=252514 RepID=UPI002249715E|nr:glycosyltransferase [Microbulbifer thermotolerans]MCX2831896.1 glycosyltransferase [Microbulbifer thermotolerans]